MLQNNFLTLEKLEVNLTTNHVKKALHQMSCNAKVNPRPGLELLLQYYYKGRVIIYSIIITMQYYYRL